MKKQYNIIIMLLFTVITVSCSPGLFQKRTTRHGESEALNYEYTNAYNTEKVQKKHFDLNLMVDEPVIVGHKKVNYETVHLRASASGSAVVRVRVNSAGQVTSYKFIKRAGVGLDDYVITFVRGTKFEPVRHKGRPQESDFILSVSIRE